MWGRPVFAAVICVCVMFIWRGATVWMRMKIQKQLLLKPFLSFLIAAQQTHTVTPVNWMYCTLCTTVGSFAEGLVSLKNNPCLPVGHKINIINNVTKAAAKDHSLINLFRNTLCLERNVYIENQPLATVKNRTEIPVTWNQDLRVEPAVRAIGTCRRVLGH